MTDKNKIDFSKYLEEKTIPDIEEDEKEYFQRAKERLTGDLDSGKEKTSIPFHGINEGTDPENQANNFVERFVRKNFKNYVIIPDEKGWYNVEVDLKKENFIL